MRTQVACEDAARIYKACGGSYDKYDQTPVCVTGEPDGDISKVAVGITQDTGISERSKNLYAMSTTGQALEDGFSREIQVSYPVPLPPFNPWRGTALPASCPYKSCPLAIPHLSSGSLDFLLEDFDKAFIRRLGDVAGGAAHDPHGSSCGSDREQKKKGGEETCSGKRTCKRERYWNGTRRTLAARGASRQLEQAVELRGEQF